VAEDHVRRAVLKNLLAVGAAVPVAGVMRGARARPRAQSVLSSAQLAGQRVVYSYPGLTVPAALLDQISAGQAAGVIFFGGNISSEAQIASVIGQLVQAQQQSPVPAPPPRPSWTCCCARPRTSHRVRRSPRRWPARWTAGS
jgi:beta-N-acetylhexosaminidase